MLITDSQVHVWAKETPDRPWPLDRTGYAHGEEHLPRSLLAAMAEAGVERAILVPASFAGDRNDLCLEASRAYPDRFAVVGRIALDDPASRELLPGWNDQPGMLGIRASFSREFSRRWLTDGTADWLWPAAELAEVPIMISVPGSRRSRPTSRNGTPDSGSSSIISRSLAATEMRRSIRCSTSWSGCSPRSRTWQ